MSCGSCNSCNCNPCSCEDQCDPANEPLSSALNNFISSFFGTVTKSCVDGAVVWALPCNLDTEAVPGFPRVVGEGLACYLARIMSEINANGSGVFNPLERYVYLVNNASDQARMGGTAENVYITFQSAYDAANAMSIALSGAFVSIMVHTSSVGDYGDLSLSADWNDSVHLIAYGDICVLGNLITNGFDVPFMQCHRIIFEGIDTRDALGGNSGDFNCFGDVLILGDVNTSSSVGDSGNIFLQEVNISGLVDSHSTSGISGNIFCFHSDMQSGIDGSSTVSTSQGLTIIDSNVFFNIDLSSPTQGGSLVSRGSYMLCGTINVSSSAGNGGNIILAGAALGNVNSGSFVMNAPLGTVGYMQMRDSRFFGSTGLPVIDILGGLSLFVNSQLLSLDTNQNCISDLDADGIQFVNCILIPDGTGFSIDASVPHTVFTFDLKDRNGFGVNVTSSAGVHTTNANMIG